MRREAFAPSRLEPPSDLTIPETSSNTARSIFSRAILRLLPELFSTLQVLSLSPKTRADVAVLYALCRDVSRRSKGALPSLLRRTPIATLIRCLRGLYGGNRDDAESLVRELLGLLLFDLGQASVLPQAIRLKAPPSRILSRFAEISIALPADTRALVFEPNGDLLVFCDNAPENGPIRVPNRAFAPASAAIKQSPVLSKGSSQSFSGVLVSKPYFPISERMSLALEDNNPLAMREAHPDKQGNRIDLGERSASEWTQTLSEALALVRDHLPDLAAEIDLFIQQIVPVGYDEENHLSASYQEAIGTIYMTLHPSLMTMTEALIHEFSHNKINTLFELDPLLENAFSPLYTSPVRPDPRPLHGVLLAVHAFLPVARLYERMIEAGHPLSKYADFLERFADIRRINAEGAEVLLENARPTEVGRGVLEEIRRWTAYYETRESSFVRA